jgi:hypothetical protein
VNDFLTVAPKPMDENGEEVRPEWVDGYGDRG